MTAAATKPERPSVPPYPNYPEGYPDKFVLFHTRFPWIYRAIVDKAVALKRRKYSSAGIRYLLEDVRYDRRIQKERQTEAVLFGIDNNLAPWYGRLIEANEPELRGFFRMRLMQSETAIAESNGQAAMEFD